MTLWTQARRSARLNPSIIREILKVTEQPGVLSSPAGCRRPRPSRSGDPRGLREGLAEVPTHALQYGPSEGYGAAARVDRGSTRHARCAQPEKVLVTTGSQQGLDLVGKVLIDAGSRCGRDADLPRRAAGFLAYRAELR